MKKLLYLLLLLPVLAIGQQGTENYIRTITYTDSIVYTATPGTIPTPATPPITNTSYFDGLGRPIGNSAYQQSASGKNILQLVVYDALGRQAKSYLPYVGATGSQSFDGTENKLMDFYGAYLNGNPVSEPTAYPYTQTVYEPSPLNRVLEQGAPGDNWAVNPNSDSDHTVKFDYQLNTALNTLDKVKLFKALATWDAANGYYAASLTNSTGTVYYDADKLMRTITKDENWTSGKNNTVEEYKNTEGQVVLKRTFSGAAAEPHNTYYVYDQFGNLTYVLPPLASGSVSATVLNGLCFQYRYDDQNRLVEKKLPGKAWEFIVYDILNRVVATGPSFSPFSNLTSVGWLVNKYDAFNRQVLTGWLPVGTSITSNDRRLLQEARDAQRTNLIETKSTTDTTINGIGFRYTTVAYPTSGYFVLTVNYYDNYDFTGAPVDFTTKVLDQKVYYNNSTRKPKGLPTGTWIRVLNGSTGTKYELNCSLYDYQANAIRSTMLNHYGGVTQVDTKLTFSGRVSYTVKTHSRVAGSSQIYIKDDYTYTNNNRLIKHTNQIGVSGIPQLMAYNTYDELGRLMNRKTGGKDITAAAYFQKTDFTYTARGWLKGINDVTNLTDGATQDLFAFKINYDTTENNTVAGVTPLYNGNISETYWRSASDDILRKYGYQYDKMNRLEKATYQRPGASPTPVWSSYDEQISYDQNGNIKTLYRTGGIDSPNAQAIDDLSFVYETSSNKLLKVTDQESSDEGFKDDAIDPATDTTDYQYDVNGNMIVDENKKISRITYNHLNLPVQITFSTPGTNLIIYLYDALGNKLKKSVAVTENGATVPTETDYLNGFQYVGASITFPTAQGYVTAANGIYNYIFNFTDHLGNVRLSYAEDPKTPGKLRILEENHYYPYGLKHQNYNAGKFEFRSDETGGNNEIVAVNDPQYKYKFNGQELQQELGLNMTAMDFRQYDNAIGRFVGMDVLSEMGFSNTPYHFANGNPVYFSDPSGLKVAPTEATAGGHIEGPSWIQTMWESTTTFSTWSNGGGGAFYNSGNTQGVDIASGELFPTLIGVGLDNINVVAGSNSNWLGLAQMSYSSSLLAQLAINKISVNAVEPTFMKSTEVIGNMLTVADFIRTSEIGNFVRSGRPALTSISKGLKFTGNALGAVGIAYGAYQYFDGQISGLEFSVDTVIAGAAILASIFAAPAVATVFAVGAIAYFGGKAIYEYTSGETMFEKPKPN